MREKILKLVVFVGLLFFAMMVYPYLATRESYEKSNTIHHAFSVAVLDDGKPGIVTWPEYQTNPQRYKAIVADTKKEYILDELDHFVLTPEGNSTFRVDYQTDDYRYWSVYSIRDGIVHPVSFRFSGAFSVFICLPLALVGTSLLWWIRRRYIN